MEIHHHLEPPGKEMKPWKHYAIEFFMLFLAVSAGFYTETLRDHIVESKRAEEIGWASERKRNAIVRSTSFLPEQLVHIRKLLKDLNEEFKIKKDS